MTPPDDATREIDVLVSRARDMLQNGQFIDAAAACDAALALDPHHGDALYTRVVAERYQRNFDRALILVDQLIALDKTNGRAHQERGHCLRDSGDSDAALASIVQLPSSALLCEMAS